MKSKSKIMKNIANEIANQMIASYKYSHTEHSKSRASQRGISEEIIQLAFCYGKEIFKQGLVFIAVQSKSLPESLSENIRKKLNNLVIVTAGDSDSIITCYRTENATKYISKKIKYIA